MTGTLAAIGVLLLLLAWFLWPTTDDRPGGLRPGVDEGELEEAEREVQEAPDEDSVRDWGPGVHKPPPA